jgi:transposase InsO family protein
MREQRVPVELCAAALGVSPSTVRRCQRPPRQTIPRASKPLDVVAVQRVRSVVRATHGLVGADGLRKQSGLSRRVCAAIKKRELRELELERKARCASVTIAAPGIVRGFDAMHVETIAGRAYWLVAADACIEYRTSIHTAPVYDADHVVAALARDFELHGPPLVLRLDRIACQRTAAIEALLSRYQVLALHGPPRHPYYYGQLERQNREHRAWYSMLGPTSLIQLACAAEAMRTALNTLWPRPSLNGWTADHVWRARSVVTVDRRELRRDVLRCTESLATRGVEALRARRIAIESALTERGLLTIKQGEWC